METKSKVRKSYRILRNDISFLYQQYAGFDICKKLLCSEWYAGAKKILVYSAIQNEVNLSAFIERALKDEKELYFPKVKGDEMEFYRVQNLSELHPGTYGILEPEEKEPLDGLIPEITPILVPGVAFSKDNYRVGYGKGYYDKYLSAKQKNIRLLPIGIAYSFQIVDEFETDEFDYPMSNVITDSLNF